MRQSRWDTCGGRGAHSWATRSSTCCSVCCARLCDPLAQCWITVRPTSVVGQVRRPQPPLWRGPTSRRGPCCEPRYCIARPVTVSSKTQDAAKQRREIHFYTGPRVHHSEGCDRLRTYEVKLSGRGRGAPALRGFGQSLCSRHDISSNFYPNDLRHGSGTNRAEGEAREGEDSEVMEGDRAARRASCVLEAKKASLHSLVMSLSER